MRAKRWSCLFYIIIGAGFFFAGIGNAAAGQVKADKEGEALPVVTTTVKGELPWTRRIGQGGEIRVKIPPQNLAPGEMGRSIRFKVRNLIEGESVFTIKAFRNGQPIKIDIEETYSLRGSVEPLLGFQNKAEEVAVRVEKGKVIAAVLAEESPFAKNKTKSFFIMPGIHDGQQGLFVDTGRPLGLIITSDSQDDSESNVNVKFYKGDYKDKIDEAEIVLKNGQSKTWEYPAEKGIKSLEIFVAKKGGVKVRVDQREPLQLTKEAKTGSRRPVDKSAKVASKPTLSEGKKEIPAGGEIPTYKGAKIIRSLSDGKQTLIQMESEASPEDIMNFYKTEMTSKGWVAKVASARGRSASLMMNKGSLTLILSAGQRKGGKTNITIRMSGK